MADPQKPASKTWSQKNPYLQLAVDATSIASFEQCPRRYYYEMILGRKRRSNKHTEFGHFLHGAYEVYDDQIAKGASKDDALDFALHHLLAATWLNGAPWQTDDPKKNRHTLIRALIWYADEQHETDGVRPYRFASGKTATEVSFRVPLPFQTRAQENFILCGHLDGLCTFGNETFIRERKTTGSTVDARYMHGYAPNVQIDTYDLAGHLLFPDLKLSGVLMDVTQTAVTFARFMRQPLYHTPRQREEWLNDLGNILGALEHYAYEAEIEAASDGEPANAFPMRRASCNNFGGCPYRSVCSLDPTQRARVLADESQFETRRWDPMEER